MSGKRVATSFLAAAMAVGTLSSAAFAENGTVDPADLNWEKPEETINISVYAGEGDQEEFLADENGGKAVMDEWLLENLNVTFDWQYMTGDMTERLNLMLADNSYPSVITNMPDDMAEKFIAQGKAVDLTEYLDDMPNLTRRMGDYINMLKDDEGHIYKLSTLWGENPNVDLILVFAGIIIWSLVRRKCMRHLRSILRL